MKEGNKAWGPPTQPMSLIISWDFDYVSQVKTYAQALLKPYVKVHVILHHHNVNISNSWPYKKKSSHTLTHTHMTHTDIIGLRSRHLRYMSFSIAT